MITSFLVCTELKCANGFFLLVTIEIIKFMPVDNCLFFGFSWGVLQGRPRVQLEVIYWKFSRSQGACVPHALRLSCGTQPSPLFDLGHDAFVDFIFDLLCINEASCFCSCCCFISDNVKSINLFCCIVPGILQITCNK